MLTPSRRPAAFLALGLAAILLLPTDVLGAAAPPAAGDDPWASHISAGPATGSGQPVDGLGADGLGPMMGPPSDAGASASWSVVTIADDDTPPEAVDDQAIVAEDSVTNVIDVLANDTDADADPLTVASAGPPAHGLVAVALDGRSLSYRPSANYSGPDAFTYVVSDGVATDIGAVDVTVVAANDPPVAVDDAISMPEDSGATHIDVLANDSDLDGDPLTITSTTTPTHGSVAIASDGSSLTYQPASDENGPDAFDYSVSDGTTTDSATVTVTILPVNDAPVAADDALSIPEDAPAPVAVHVLADDHDVDGDLLTVACPTEGDDHKGAVTAVGLGTDCAYQPFPGAFGMDGFSYTVSDGTDTATATVSVTITSGNHAPNAVNDQLTVPEGAGPTPLAVLGNDLDPDHNSLTITARTNGAHGAVAITGGGTGLSYDPAGDYTGVDTFTYTISDGVVTDTATVVVTVVKDATKPVVTAPDAGFPGQTVGTSTTRARIHWSGSDAGSGVKAYTVQVSTNGGPYVSVPLATPTSTSVDRLLTTGRSYRFRVRATDREGNTGSFAYGPIFKVAAYGDASSTLRYSAAWGLSRSTRYLGGTDHFTTSAARSVTWTVRAWDVGWVTTRATTSGRARVVIDGTLVATVTLGRSSNAWRQLVFARHFTTLATHTIVITPVGDGRVDLDGFAILY